MTQIPFAAGHVRDSLNLDLNSILLNSDSVHWRPPVVTIISKSKSLAMDGWLPGGTRISKMSSLDEDDMTW